MVFRTRYHGRKGENQPELPTASAGFVCPQLRITRHRYFIRTSLIPSRGESAPGDFPNANLPSRYGVYKSSVHARNVDRNIIYAPMCRDESTKHPIYHKRAPPRSHERRNCNLHIKHISTIVKYAGNRQDTIHRSYLWKQMKEPYHGNQFESEYSNQQWNGTLGLDRTFAFATTTRSYQVELREPNMYNDGGTCERSNRDRTTSAASTKAAANLLLLPTPYSDSRTLHLTFSKPHIASPPHSWDSHIHFVPI